MIRRVVNGVLDRQGWADGVGELLQKIYLAVPGPLPGPRAMRPVRRSKRDVRQSDAGIEVRRARNA